MISKGIQIVITARNAMAQGVSGAMESLGKLRAGMARVWQSIYGPIGLVITAYFALRRVIGFVSDAMTRMRRESEKAFRVMADARMAQMASTQKAFADEVKRTADNIKRWTESQKEQIAVTRAMADAERELAKQRELAALNADDEAGRKRIEQAYAEKQSMEDLTRAYQDNRAEMQTAKRAPFIANKNRMESKRLEKEIRAELSATYRNRPEGDEEQDSYKARVEGLREQLDKQRAMTAQYEQEQKDANQRNVNLEKKAQALTTAITAKRLEQQTDAKRQAVNEALDIFDAEVEGMVEGVNKMLKAQEDRHAKELDMIKRRRDANIRAADEKRKADEAEIRRADDRIGKIRDLARATMAERAEAQKTEKERQAVEKAEAKRAREIFQKMTGADRKAGLMRPDGPIRRLGERDERFRGQGLGRSGDIQRIGRSMVTEEEQRWLQDYMKRTVERKELQVLEKIREDLQQNLRMG